MAAMVEHLVERHGTQAVIRVLGQLLADRGEVVLLEHVDRVAGEHLNEAIVTSA